MPTAENRRFVQLALACGQSEDDIATALGINARTLNRHYFHELSGKRSARMRLDMKNMAAIVGQVEAGNVAAMALLEKKIAKLDMKALAQRAAHVDRKPKPLGKKEAAKEAAAEVAGKYAPRASPTLYN